MEKMAEWLEREYPEAARSLREGLQETFTINRLDLPPSLHRCLGTTSLIESPQSGVRKRTGNVCRWREADMVLRWVAGAYLITEKNFRKIMGWPTYASKSVRWAGNLRKGSAFFRKIRSNVFLLQIIRQVLRSGNLF
jgi:hypothetical protein